MPAGPPALLAIRRNLLLICHPDAITAAVRSSRQCVAGRGGSTVGRNWISRSAACGSRSPARGTCTAQVRPRIAARAEASSRSAMRCRPWLSLRDSYLVRCAAISASKTPCSSTCTLLRSGSATTSSGYGAAAGIARTLPPEGRICPPSLLLLFKAYLSFLYGNKFNENRR